MKCNSEAIVVSDTCLEVVQLLGTGQKEVKPKGGNQ